jgi:hypothetical protein
MSSMSISGLSDEMDRRHCGARQQVLREKRKHEPRPQVQEVIVSVRNAAENDPGECAIGYFIVQGNCITLTDENGNPLDEKDGTAKIGDANPRSIAQMMTRKRWEGTRGGGDFNGLSIRRADGPRQGIHTSNRTLDVCLAPNTGVRADILAWPPWPIGDTIKKRGVWMQPLSPTAPTYQSPRCS